jgi:hypothetical protein
MCCRSVLYWVESEPGTAYSLALFFVSLWIVIHLFLFIWLFIHSSVPSSLHNSSKTSHSHFHLLQPLLLLPTTTTTTPPITATTQFDPVVEVGVDDSGQHTMVCLGELHLQQCLKTLVERFTK